MGMFDYVIPEYPIEGIPNAAALEWQTKDFADPFLKKYRITRDGRLEEEIVRYEDRGDKTAPEGTFARFIGCMTPVHDGWRDMNYHGDLYFGHGVGSESIDICARFTNGQLEWIRRDDADSSVPVPEAPSDGN